MTTESFRNLSPKLGLDGHSKRIHRVLPCPKE
jgi:hypothetical protein